MDGDSKNLKKSSSSINLITKTTIDGASAFLSRICLPAADEFGLLLKDKVSGWRANNAVKIANKAQKIVEEKNKIEVSSPPKLVYSIIENGSWAEEDFIQDLWAGLLASSCTSDGKDESNHILINLLSQLVKSQVKLVNYICTEAQTYKSSAGWIYAEDFSLTSSRLMAITEINDIHQLDRELDHLRSLGLINSGFDVNSFASADVTPTALCLQLYIRSQGYVGSPTEYFKSPEKEKRNNIAEAYEKTKKESQNNRS